MRASSLRLIPTSIVIVTTLYLWTRGGTRGQPGWLAHVVGYVRVSTLLLVLFWPEAIRLAGSPGEIAPDARGVVCRHARSGGGGDYGQ